VSAFHLSNTVKSFSDISVGDHLDGGRVSEIVLGHDNYIIYRTDEGLRYFSINVSNPAMVKMNQLDLLQAKAVEKFKNINSGTTDSYIISVVSLIFISDCSQEDVIKNIDRELDRFLSFIEDEPAPSLVVASNKDYAVYLDAKFLVGYNIINKLLYKSTILDEFYRLRAWGAVVLPESKVRLLSLKLATCLAIGFRANLAEDVFDVSKIFSPAVAYIEKNIIDAAAYYLIMYVIVFSFVVMLASALLYYNFSTVLTSNLNMLLMGLFGGVCGALISVLQRSKKLQVGLYESTKIIVLQGVVRVGLGCAFGVISLVACKAGLLLDLMSESNSRLLILAIIAGFSERLIPDFIEKTSSERAERAS